jgi:hypothetical protein
MSIEGPASFGRKILHEIGEDERSRQFMEKLDLLDKYISFEDHLVEVFLPLSGSLVA